MRCGWIQPAHSAAAAQTIIARTRQWTARRAPVELLARDRVGALLGTGGYGAGGSTSGPARCIRWRTPAGSPCRDNSGGTHSYRSPAVRIVARKRNMGRDHASRRGASAAGRPRDRRLLGSCGRISSSTRWSSPASRLRPTSARDRPPAILPGGTVASDTRRLLYYFRLDADGRFIIGGRGRSRSVPEGSMSRCNALPPGCIRAGRDAMAL